MTYYFVLPLYFLLQITQIWILHHLLSYNLFNLALLNPVLTLVLLGTALSGLHGTGFKLPSILEPHPITAIYSSYSGLQRHLRGQYFHAALPVPPEIMSPFQATYCTIFYAIHFNTLGYYSTLSSTARSLVPMHKSSSTKLLQIDTEQGEDLREVILIDLLMFSLVLQLHLC